MKALIDSNAYTELFLGNTMVADFLEEADVVYLSVVVIAELLTGFRAGRLEKQNRDYLKAFIKQGGKTLVLPVVYETAERFSLIKDSLRRKGRPIPLNDIWIAAQCMETGATLVTFDTHFKEVEGLLVWEGV